MAAKPQPHSAPHASPAPDAAHADADADADAGRFALFRVLLPPSFSDADTMNLYTAINPLCSRTTAVEVCVELLDPASAGGRVVSVVGPVGPVRRVEASSSSAVPLALSPAQEALVAVMDTPGTLYCAGEEEEARGKAPPHCVSCVLLVDAYRLEGLVGRGLTERIALEAGANLRVRMWDKAAQLRRGQPLEEVVEITGDRTAVKKALVALSSCLQASSETHCPESKPDQTKSLQKVSFRLLLPTSPAGGLKSLIIKGIEDETGACIDVGGPVIGCKEHVVTIFALESPDSQHHIVQSALALLFDRMMEMESNAHSVFEKAPQFSARALVLKNQVDCLGGSIIKEMVNATGARIQILDDADVPACAFNFERVLQISGDRTAVRKALVAVSTYLQGDVPINTSASIVKEEAPIPQPELPRHIWERTPSPPLKRQRGRSLPPGSSEIGLHGARRSSSSPPSKERTKCVDDSMDVPKAILSPLTVFWDYENCRVSNGTNAKKVCDNIRQVLHMNFSVQEVRIRAYGVPKKVRNGIQRGGVEIVELENRRKDAADKLILVDMLAFAYDHRTASILLISGDGDFTPAVKVLVDRGHTTGIAVPSEDTAAADLMRAGSFVWDWPSLARGVVLIPSSVPDTFEVLKAQMIQLFHLHNGHIGLKFILPAYRKAFGKQIRLGNYSVPKLIDLFKNMKKPFCVIENMVFLEESMVNHELDPDTTSASGLLIQNVALNTEEDAYGPTPTNDAIEPVIGASRDEDVPNQPRIINNFIGKNLNTEFHSST